MADTHFSGPIHVGDNKVLDEQQAAVADVATADADATYGQAEADLINELKAQLNLALAALRAHGLIAT